MAKTLDKQKPYGTVHGDDQGRFYTQDGTYFDNEGKEWQPPADVAPEATPEASPEPESGPEPEPAHAKRKR
jgi:hypothetical protein